jgi:L-malate glycosyltransferase
MAKPIIVTGYPYAYPYYFKVFEYLKNKEDYIFILPKYWEAKKGKVKIDLHGKPGFKIYGAKAISYGGRSLFSGLFKGWMPQIALKLAVFRLKLAPGVLYSCSEPNLFATLYNGIFAKIFGYKHILFTWQNVAPEERMSGLKLRLSNFLVRLNLAFSDGVICGNQKAAEIIKRFAAHRSQFKVLVCPLAGVDIEKFKVVDREPGTTSHEPKTILFYGALEERKGVNILIQAFSKITNPDSRLVIIGTGPEKEKLINLAGELGINDRIIFHDWMKNEELPAILAKSEIFVYPSLPKGGWEEQFGYAMGEASACEVPVVASRTGSIDEVVKDGETGILVEPANVDELSLALIKLLNDNELRRKMGRKGREYISNNFSHEIVADKINNFLNEF